MILLGETLQVLGEILLGAAVIRVHGRVLHEHKIDNVVFKAIQRERKLGVVAIILLTAGYIVRVI